MKTDKTKKPYTGKKRGRKMGSTGGIRVDSLWPALGDDARRQKLCQWIFAEGLSQPACLAKIEQEFGLKTSKGALHFFIAQQSFLWKVSLAKQQATIEKDQLPADWDARIREALAQRKFVAVFKELSERQLAAFEKLELEYRKLDIKSSQVFLAERRLDLLEKKLEVETQQPPPGGAASPALSAEEEQQRFRKILGQE